ncbi:MAG: hypothetical protein ACTIJ9_04730 [Aequorivita sp.]
MKNLLFIFLFSIAGLQAQEGKHEKIKALKTAYITDKLALTSTEAERFWPIYNKYREEFHTLKVQEHNDIFQKLHNGIEKLTDIEANELIDKDLSIEASKLALRKEMTSELRKVISPKKIILLKKTENDFKRELLERYRHGREKRK